MVIGGAINEKGKRKNGNILKDPIGKSFAKTKI